MAEAQQADHEFVNLTKEANKEKMKAIMQMMLEQQKQLKSLMEKFSLAQGMDTKERKHLLMQRSAPGVRRKHMGGV